VWRFGARLYTDAAGPFGAMPTPEPSKRPTFNTPSFGVAFASLHRVKDLLSASRV